MAAQIQVKFKLSDGTETLVNVPFIESHLAITAMQLVINNNLILSFPFTMDNRMYVRYPSGSDDDS